IKEFPFDDKVSVYKVGGKMFALAKEAETPLRINLKCDPLYALELRSIYEFVIPGYHMNKKHWNTVICNGEVDNTIIMEWVDDSYELIVKSLPKKLRDSLT
ncbi:MAG: MmcQ/YjbR family DNA-binding protein, partial [Sulfurimonadaceae bacterium]|nr:MmcQ/YjbR family DNA-binding protein [Sulfurimonadaceae bacterium]